MVYFDPDVRPKFSRSFIQGLEKINQVILEKTKEEQIQAMQHFIKKFGTHYSVKTRFGASMIYESRYTSAGESEEQKAQRQNCAEESLHGCTSYGTSLWGMSACTET